MSARRAAQWELETTDELATTHSKPPGSNVEHECTRQREAEQTDAVTQAAADNATRTNNNADQTLNRTRDAAAALSFMRLAIVERQLIMQGLDITSLARLASTCRQLRAEALHREAGKLIPTPSFPLIVQCQLDQALASHSSPLFRAHVPVTLCLRRDIICVTPAYDLQSLLTKAASFSRITRLELDALDPKVWTEARILHLLAQPWMQQIERMGPSSSFWISQDARPLLWLQNLAVQHAIFALPALTAIDIRLTPQDHLFHSAIAQATKLRTAYICAEADSLRALRFAPALSCLTLHTERAGVQGLADSFAWCLPATLTSLTLISGRGWLSRSRLKTMFTRLPLLQTVRAESMQIAPLLQGLLDAGVGALPQLRRVEFQSSPMDASLALLLRRFLHKFPNRRSHRV